MILALQGVPLVIVSIIAFIIILGVIILIHEGGHFFFARRAGILCHEFSIGMGPAIYKKKWKETTFCIRAIPIGGYVSMAGEEVSEELVKTGQHIGLNFRENKVCEIILDEKIDAMIRGEVVEADLYGKDGNTLFITIHDGISNQYFEVLNDASYVFPKGKKMQVTPYDRCFESKSLWKRFITLFAGPMMNFVLAIVIYLIVAFCTGVPNQKSTTIGAVSYGAADILEVGDEIKEINGKSVSSWTEVSEALDTLVENAQTKVSVTFLRDGEKKIEDVECTTYIASLGLSNIQAPTKDLPEGIEGLIVGNVELRYLKDKGTYPLQNGDIITKIRVDRYEDGKFTEGVAEPITSWGQLVRIFNDVDVANVRLEYYSYEKKGIVSLEESSVLQTYGNEVLKNQRIEKIQIRVGISPKNHFDFFGSIGLAFENFWSDFTLIFRTLALLIAPSGIRQVGVNDLSSFVGIFSLVETFIGAGFLSLLAFTAMLSVNIGVMNLLPIPALDGGRIVFLGYELITRRKPSRKVENIINNIFFILLMILFLYVTYHDIIRLINK